MSRPLLSLFTDASLVQSTGRAGWGFWAKKEGSGSVSGGGILRPPVLNSNEAEYKAVANALTWLVNTGYLVAKFHVLIQLDNMHVVRFLGRGQARIDKAFAEREVHDYIVALKQKHDFSILTRHIKGHQSNKTGRTWVNNSCDAIARRYSGAKT